MPLTLLLLSLCLISCNNNTVKTPDCAGVSGGSAVEDCAGECGGSAVLDECDVCNGTGIADGKCDCSGNVEDACGVCGGNTDSEVECLSCDSEICIYIINVNYENNSLDLLIINSVAVAGFQFDISGISITTASGGLAEENGFNVNSGSSTILGFSFGAAVIPSNSYGVLVNIIFTDIITDICIENAIFSSTSGTALSLETIDCVTTDD
jgi:hypothetical protein